jgi:hypothetical protein
LARRSGNIVASNSEPVGEEVPILCVRSVQVSGLCHGHQGKKVAHRSTEAQKRKTPLFQLHKEFARYSHIALARAPLVKTQQKGMNTTLILHIAQNARMAPFDSNLLLMSSPTLEDV